MVITSSTRQGLYVIFIILMMFVGMFFLGMNSFECLVIVGLAGIVLKLTDVEEAINR
jgi:uncharacterized membrane protein